MPGYIGKYELEAVLGEGAFGIVYRALDPDLQKSFAVKKLKTGPQESQAEAGFDTRLLFMSEARETSKLSHSNIVIVHGLGVDESDQSPYLVMELLEGRTLQSLIRHGPQMTLAEKIEIMQQVGEGLQYAHTRGVIHRDIKPANIMVLADGTAKVMDFAVAPEGSIVGTRVYMAPEQFRAAFTSDVLTNIFSYGLVYYELLTGRRAFDADDPQRSQTSPYEPPRVAGLLPDCPAWLDLLVSRLISKHRDERIESLEEMLVETRPVLQKLKRERATELANGIGPALQAGDREEARRLIERVRRLDPLNQVGREYWGRFQTGKRRQAQARARELMTQGQEAFDNGDFEAAEKSFADALALDHDPALERWFEKARLKAEDCRTAARLLDEVIEDITDAGPLGMTAWLVENAFAKLTRAAQLDPRNRDVADMRADMLPVYERECDRKLAPRADDGAGVSSTEWSRWYDRRIKEAAKARKNRDFDHAEGILRKLLPHAVDSRAQRELNAVAEDRQAWLAAGEALRRSREWKARGDLEAARRELEEFAEQHFRWAGAVREERLALEREASKTGAPAGAPEGPDQARPD